MVGGEDLDTFEYTKRCFKFNVNSLNWEEMPKLENARLFPGLF